MSLQSRFSQLHAPSVFHSGRGYPLLWSLGLEGRPATAVFDPRARSGFVLRAKSDRSEVAFHLDGRIARCLQNGVDHALDPNAEGVLSAMIEGDAL